MKLLLLLFFSSLLSLDTEAQSLKLSGKIEDLKTKLPYLEDDEKLDYLYSIVLLSKSDSSIVYAKQAMDYAAYRR